MKGKNMQLTIFTPTYNRKELLERCYTSMLKQTNQNFVWMIIDDGSTDNTGKMVDKWKREVHGFELQYYYKKNGGLHTAYNEAIRLSETELMVCIDSDDYMPIDAVEKILSFWNKNGSDKYAGIVALDVFEDGSVVGDLLPNLDAINLIGLLTNKYGIKNGDRKLVVRTDLYKQYAPMPSFNGEKNFNPHYMHLQISVNYDFLVFNEPLCVVEYQDNGMSKAIFKQYLNSPLSFAQTRRFYMSLPGVSRFFIFKQCIHYVSSCLIAKTYKDIWKKTRNLILTILAFPFGLLLSLYIRGVQNYK